MLRVPLSKEDYFALQRFNMRRFGISEDAIEEIIASWYPLIGTRAVLPELYNRGWIADEEDIIAFLGTAFPEFKHQLIDNLDRLIWEESGFEYPMQWLVTHQRGRLSPIGELIIAHGFESIDELLAAAAQRIGHAAIPGNESKGAGD
jgi:hypothetical protein